MKKSRENQILFLSAIIAFFLGFVAFIIILEVHTSKTIIEAASRIFDALYATISLFVLNGPQDISEQHNAEQLASWMLHIAKFLAAGSLAIAVWKGFKSIFRPWLEERELRNRTGHTIIMGTGKEARAFIKSCISQKEKISVLVSNTNEKEFLKDRFNQNIAVYVGEPSTTQSWEFIGAAKAQNILLVSENDLENISAQNSIKTLKVENRSKQPIRVFTHIKNNRLRQELVRQTEAFASSQGMRIEPFSVPELAARQFFHRQDFFNNIWLQNHNAVHWLVFGFSNSTATFLNHFAKVCPFPKFGKASVTIVASSDTPELEDSMQILSLCSDFIDVRHIDEDVSKKMLSIDLIQTINQENITSTLISDLGGRELECALELRGLAQREGILKAPIFVDHPSLKQFSIEAFGKVSDALHDKVEQVGDLESICNLQFMTGKIDKLAQYFHDKYLPPEAERNVEKYPAHRDWDDLDENLKNANRRAADHAKTKCEAMGVLGNFDPAYVSGFFPDHIDGKLRADLSEKEHDSWHIDRILSGWKFNAVRDDFCRLHPNMVPFNKLSERTKSLDREQVSTLIELLGKRGECKSEMTSHVFIGLIGHNHINKKAVTEIQKGLKNSTFPNLKKRYPNSRIVFLTPLAPGGDLVMAETAISYFASCSNTELKTVKSVKSDVLIKGYTDRIGTESVWTSVNELNRKSSDSSIEGKISAAINRIEKQTQTIDISTNSNHAKKNPFILNAEYFCSRLDILIAFADKNKNTHGIAGIAKTLENARKNGVEIFEI